MEFDVECRMDFEKYRMLLMEFRNTVNKTYLKQGLMLAAMVVIILVLTLALHDTSLAIIFAGVYAVLIPTATIRFNRQLKKSWDTNTLRGDNIWRYHFDETKVVETAASGEQTVEYAQVLRLRESKHGLFFMISATQGMMLDKSVCTEEQLEWIRRKCGGTGKQS